jgi:hypothetical protein
MIRLSFIWLLLLGSTALHGQSAAGCGQLLADKSLYSASATGPNEAEAQASARALLLQQIYTLVTSRTDMKVEAGNTSSDQSFQNLSTTRSSLRLDGLRYVTCPKDKKDNSPDVTVVCYISRADMMRSGSKVGEKVMQHMELYERKNEMGLDGMVDLHLAYLESFFTPMAIPYRTGRDSVSDIQTYLGRKLEDHLRTIDLNCKRAEQHPQYPQEQIRLHLSMKGIPAMGINYVFSCTAHNASATLSDGGGKMDVLMQPASTNEVFKGRLTMMPMLMSEELKSIADAVQISRDIEFTADMTSIVRLNFDVKEKSDNVQLVPKVERLSFSSIEWFSDGRLLSSEQSPLVPRSSIGSEVTMRLSRNDRLQMSKPMKGRSGVGVVRPVEPQKAVGGEGIRAVPEAVPTSGNDQSLGTKHGLNLLKDFNDLQAKLKELKTSGKAQVGKKENFLHPANCWVILVEPDTKTVAHILSPRDQGRKDMRTGQTYPDFENTLKGYIAIWLELY